MGGFKTSVGRGRGSLGSMRGGHSSGSGQSTRSGNTHGGAQESGSCGGNSSKLESNPWFLEAQDEPASAAEADKYSLFTIWGSSQAASLNPPAHTSAGQSLGSSPPGAAGLFGSLADSNSTMGLYPRHVPVSVDAAGELRAHMLRLEARVGALERENMALLQQMQQQQQQQAYQQQQLDAAISAMQRQQNQHQHNPNGPISHEPSAPRAPPHMAEFIPQGVSSSAWSAPVPVTESARTQDGHSQFQSVVSRASGAAAGVGAGAGAGEASKRPPTSKGSASSSTSAFLVGGSAPASVRAALPAPSLHLQSQTEGEAAAAAAAAAETLKVLERLSTLEGRQTSLQKKIASLDQVRLRLRLRRTRHVPYVHCMQCKDWCRDVKRMGCVNT